MSNRELTRYYTLSPEEIEVINHRLGAANRLGFAVQFGYLRFPGRPLSPQETERLLLDVQVSSAIRYDG